MPFESGSSEPRGIFGGKIRLLLSGLLVVIFVVTFPGYRLLILGFVLISVLIGVVAAGVLHFWNKSRPVKAEEIHNKRPLGLE